MVTLSQVKVFVALFLLLATVPIFAENWTVADGTVYREVKVIRVEDDAVTILCKDGGALVPLFKLSPELQKRFSYDPAKAKVAAEARAKQDAENAKQLQAEIDQAQKMKLQVQIDQAKQIEDASTNAIKR